MVNGMKLFYLYRLNKGFCSKFIEDSRVRQETPEEGRKVHRSKHWVYNNKDEENSPNTLNNINHSVKYLIVTNQI